MSEVVLDPLPFAIGLHRRTRGSEGLRSVG
jgi:hypothetical protein